MPEPLLPDRAAARQVRTTSLAPVQHATPLTLKTACDYRERTLIKHPGRSEFHAWAEYLHAGLLEGDPHVTTYVPQPLRLRVNGRYYTPDCYVVYDNGPRKVLELKPRAEFPDTRRRPLEAYFAQHGLVFEVVSNESVYARQTEAENWLTLVQTLVIAESLETTTAEDQVWETLHAGPRTLGELIDPGDRERTYPQEVALFRLAHRGQVHAALTERPLDYDTEFRLCH